MVKAGEVRDIQWASGNWLIFDIGFSNRKRSRIEILGISGDEFAQLLIEGVFE